MGEKECELVRALRFLGRETISGRVSITWQAADRITRLEADRVELIRIINEAMIWDGADSEGVDAVWLSDARETLARIKDK